MTFPLPGANWSYLHGLRLVATTGEAGFALQDATPAILTWTAPDDGQLHRVLIPCLLAVTSAETGGAIQLNAQDPSGNSHNYSLISAGQSAGGHLASQMAALPVAPGSTVTLSQSTALTAGAAALWAEIWGY